AQRVLIKGIAHITGGGLLENVPRILPESVCAVIDRMTWPRPAIFDWLQRAGGVEDAEMHRVFNCGVGMVLIVSQADAQRAVAEFASVGEQCRVIGTIERRGTAEAGCRVVA
ncbi:MAG TPA: AIR synthase-related protein, partial [Burkholderiaceae bacterium]|nr:AIR synthase-related protein [Burkholderiaceae bacterium]